MKAARFDIHQEITDRIVEAIENGAGDFKMPWHQSTPLFSPQNSKTNKLYRGVNILSLWVTAHQQGYASNQWATFKQWQEAGCQVRKGEKGTPIVFYTKLMREGERDQTTGETPEVSIPYARASFVFNAAQVDGADIPENAPQITSVFDRLEHVEQVITNSGAKVISGGERAFYRPFDDTVHMPEAGMFIGTETSTPQEAYYSTLLHELSHWTGAPHRLNRTKGKKFGDQAYAYEELVAELSAAFLCSDLSIVSTPRKDHAQYIASWLKVLKNDKRAIFNAASEASQATDFILQHHTSTKEQQQAA